jgi:NAD(P)-dependent dehydrogenase (short-subunit alcohol dehydrogenase family)
MAELTGKVAVVTGGGGGIGRATSLLLAERGATVLVADLDEAAAKAVADAVAGAGGGALAVTVDVSSEDGVRALAAMAAAQFGGVDILHNNAALTDVAPDGVMTDLDMAYWDRVMAVNVRGYALGVKHLVPQMIERGGGVVVNTSSAAGLQGDLVRIAYGTSKAAIIGLTRYVATQYGRFGVRCIGIAPGLIRTPVLAEQLPPEAIDLLASHHLTPRIGRPEDIAELVAFVASDRGSFITGTTIAVDGGFSAHSPTYVDTLRMFEGSDQPSS